MGQSPRGQAKESEMCPEATGNQQWSLSTTNCQYLRKINLNEKQCPQWSRDGSRGGCSVAGAEGGHSSESQTPLNKIPQEFFSQLQILSHLPSSPQPQKNIIVENIDSGFRLPGFESQHCHLLAVHFQTCSLTSL